ncbi:hypothetical protein TrLO_g14207 [Triparma laevis f. longispina]|uniref:Uncharacterized protein n=1 Tax=Triparma laevis f. longispina TaxID=1714387 RepID=A0A9W7F0T6_9STRA|nr:hypothetical protein TrLO_g14207 [Triparma laevis f. longispina]
MERALGEENVVTLETLNSLGAKLEPNGEFEESKEVYERCLAGRMKVLGGEHKNTLGTLSNLGVAYWELRNNEKALEYYEGSERMLGKTHPRTLDTVMNIACVYDEGLENYGKAEELYESALEGKEAQLGKDEENTIRSARNLRNCLVRSGNYERLAQLLAVYPKLKTN